MLIVLALKGPSWYKLYYNYRHRKLEGEEKDEGNAVSTVRFSEMGRHRTRQTITFNQKNGKIEDNEEDEYYEDPYIKREEEDTEEWDYPDP